MRATLRASPANPVWWMRSHNQLTLSLRERKRAARSKARFSCIALWYLFLFGTELDTPFDETFADVVAKEKPMSARRRRRSNSNSKDEPTNSYSDYIAPVSGTGSSMSASLMSLPPPASSAGEMGCRDRTQEFRSITMSLRSSQVTPVCFR